ncbi:MAG: multiheme c-type cytochrome, partial [Planctomycetota bacterium]
IWITSESRWIPYGSIFFIPSSRLSMKAGLWNRSCIECHVVSGRPRSEADSEFDSHVAEFGISCEACHGPAEEHIAKHSNPLNRYQQHLSQLDESTMVSPLDLAHDRSSEVCGQCHSVFQLSKDDKKEFNRNGFAYRPGDDLHECRNVIRYNDEDLDDPKIARKRQGQFWSDGMVRVSGREYNGLLETPCFQRGKMSCLSCHSMHSEPGDSRTRAEWADDQLKPQMRENQACIQCHQEYSSNEQLKQHTHHAPESNGSNCYNCHMPHTTLGLMKAMRSHTIDSPNVSVTKATGRPNACNLCHLDKTLAWTSEKLSSWYGIESPELNMEEKSVASSIRWILLGDAGQRAIAGWHFRWKPAQDISGTGWMAPYLAELLRDSYDVVRFIGYHSLKALPGFDEFEYDFVGPESDRNRKSVQALKIWEAFANSPAVSRELLIGEKGGIIKSRYQQIRSQRLDPPFYLSE